ncbi:hypothetical protein GF337_07730 [candidate division KSB1 bacterium]|nr:hypothetical protein [candidate division KSB1 bacterium]
MKKIVRFVFFLSLVSSLSVAYSEAPHRTAVGPGIWHHEIYLTEGPWAIHILEIDLTNHYVKIETAKAKEQLQGRTPTSEIARSNSRSGHRVVAAVNGDFFSSEGVPVGAQISDGVLVSSPVQRSVFGITADKEPFISIVDLNAKLFTRRNIPHQIHVVNSSRRENQLILYNSFRGKRTGTNQWGTEVIVKLSNRFMVNDTIHGIVTEIDSVSGNNSVEEEQIVLSGHNEAGNFLKKNMRIQDSLKIIIGVPPVTAVIGSMIGGLPRIIRDGNRSVEYAREKIPDKFATDRHPRTAVGISKDEKKMYFVTVDGRQPGFSAGMSLDELSGFMLNLGVYQGMNLDGGGSTTMVINNKVVNRPSDATGERPVANALLVVSTAPVGKLTYLRIYPESITLLPGQTCLFKVQGFDKYHNPVPLNGKKIHWSCDQKIGTVDQTGKFRANANTDYGYVHVQFGELAHSAKVRVYHEID